MDEYNILDLMPYADFCVRCGALIYADELVYRNGENLEFIHFTCPDLGGDRAVVLYPSPDEEFATL